MHIKGSYFKIVTDNHATVVAKFEVWSAKGNVSAGKECEVGNFLFY